MKEYSQDKKTDRGVIVSGDIDEYRKEVRKSAEDNDAASIMNDGVEYASVLLQEGIDHATSTFDLLTTSLDPRVYDDATVGLIPRFQKFSGEKEAVLRILLRNDDAVTRQSEFIEKILYHQVYGNVEVRIIPKNIQLENSDVNDFFISDYLNKDIAAYRYETNMKKLEAIASFGHSQINEKNVQILSQHFDSFWKVSEPVKLKENSQKKN